MKHLYTLFLLFILNFSFLITEAQTPIPGGGGAEGAPFDGFTFILLIAGVGYGVYRMGKTASDNKTY